MARKDAPEGARRWLRRHHVGAFVLGFALAAGATGALAAGDLTDVFAPDRDAAPVTTAPPTTAPSTTAPSTTAPPTAAPSTTAPGTTAPPTTTSPPLTTAPPTTEPAGTLRPGDEGPAVADLQHRLLELGYWLGDPDGHYGDLTRQAVLAFQKAEGLERDGIAGPATLARLGEATRPAPRSSDGDLIEIDLARQIMLVVQDGQTVWVLNTSTGASGTRTPPGQFTITREIDGMRHAPLGNLYRPKYFNGGIAIHGYPKVPEYPASHGCTRVSYPAMDMLWASGMAEVGTTVLVY